MQSIILKFNFKTFYEMQFNISFKNCKNYNLLYFYLIKLVIKKVFIFYKNKRLGSESYVKLIFFSFKSLINL